MNRYLNQAVKLRRGNKMIKPEPLNLTPLFMTALLYHRDHERLRAYCQRLTRNNLHLTEDIVQATWTKVAKAERKGTMPLQPEFPWLAVIARNEHQDIIRPDRREANYLQSRQGVKQPPET